MTFMKKHASLFDYAINNMLFCNGSERRTQILSPF